MNVLVIKNYNNITNMNMELINFNNLLLLNPYNIYDVTNLNRNIKINDTIVFGYNKLDKNLINDNSNELLDKYDLYIFKFDIDNEDIIGFNDNEINIILNSLKNK